MTLQIFYHQIIFLLLQRNFLWNESCLLKTHLIKKLNINNKKYLKLKILGSGDLKDKITVEANFFSKSAKDKLEKIGGIAQILKK